MRLHRKRIVPPSEPAPAGRLRQCLYLAVAAGIAFFVLRSLFDFLVSRGIIDEKDAAGLFMLSLPVALATIIGVMPFGSR